MDKIRTKIRFWHILFVLLQAAKAAEFCLQLGCRVFSFQLVVCDGTDVDKSCIAQTKWAVK